MTRFGTVLVVVGALLLVVAVAPMAAGGVYTAFHATVLAVPATAVLLAGWALRRRGARGAR